MTFRLVNAGRKEIWHPKEFLYHTWHPGTDGKRNYLGPHDGRNMSTTALKARMTGRISPLVENPAMRMLRLKQDDIIYEPLLLQAIPEEDAKNWTIEKLSKRKRPIWVPQNLMEHPMVNLRLTITFSKMLIQQFYIKATQFSRKPKSLKDILKKVSTTYRFLRNMAQYNAYIFGKCENCIEELASNNIHEIALYGTGDVAQVLYKLTMNSPVKIKAVYDTFNGKKFFNFDVTPVEAMKDYQGKVIVADLVRVEEKVEKLKRVGLRNKNIIIL